MKSAMRMTIGVAALATAVQAAASITLYQNEDFRGRAFTADRAVRNFDPLHFNDRASSALVQGERWEVCADAGFRGRCVVLRPGSYASLRSMGLDDRVSSVRAIRWDAWVDESRYAPVVIPGDAYRRRHHERLYQADVASVRAVVGPPEQRCWIEREQVVQQRGDASVPGAIIGAVIGGILGHQVGGGRGKDVATAGGAIGGAIVGANVGRGAGGQEVSSRDVRRCTTLPRDERVDYWDVTYYFGGREHRVQMSVPPGPTITVNAEGEPRA
jgi:uncharacterized protein YcfJ